MMTIPSRIGRSMRELLTAGSAFSLLVASAGITEAQLRMTTWRADNGQVYQVLQHRDGEDLGIGIDEVRVTTIVANTFSAYTCVSPVNPLDPNDALEALTSGPIGGRLPLDRMFKSRLIADASEPCFSNSAVDGLGSICIGPACDGECACADDAECQVFTIADGVALDTETTNLAAVMEHLPFSVQQAECATAGSVSYSFGSNGSPTTQVERCTMAPADGFRLPGSPSIYTGGVAGTTIVFAYQVAPEEDIYLSASGFGLDNDGDNPFGCDAAGMVVGAIEANGEGEPVLPPPGPPVDLDAQQRQCQRSIGRAGRRYVTKVLKVLQQCRDKILSGAWPIEASDCSTQPMAARVIESATRVARSSIRSKCASVDLQEMLTCGNTIDELIAADGSGCIADSHRSLAEQLATVEYGF